MLEAIERKGRGRSATRAVWKLCGLNQSGRIQRLLPPGSQRIEERRMKREAERGLCPVMGRVFHEEVRCPARRVSLLPDL